MSKITEYPIASSVASGDLLDISKKISTSPDIFQSQKLDYATLLATIPNIYTENGSLTGNRVVTMGANTLDFSGNLTTFTGLNSVSTDFALKVKNSASTDMFGVQNDSTVFMGILKGYNDGTENKIRVDLTNITANSSNLSSFDLRACIVGDYLNFNTSAYLQNAQRIIIGTTAFSLTSAGGGVGAFYGGSSLNGNIGFPLNTYSLPLVDTFISCFTPSSDGMIGNKHTFFSSQSVFQLYSDTGWTMPTGSILKTGFNADWTQTISAVPTQSEVEAVRDQLIDVQKHLAALIRLQGRSHVSATANDLTDEFTITSHGALERQSFKIISGTPPNPLALNTTYYVAIGGSITANTFKVALTPTGVVVDLTTSGSNIVVEFSNSGMNLLTE